MSSPTSANALKALRTFQHAASVLSVYSESTESVGCHENQSPTIETCSSTPLTKRAQAFERFEQLEQLWATCPL
jgi:hypothetical protein